MTDQEEEIADRYLNKVVDDKTDQIGLLQKKRLDASKVKQKRLWDISDKEIVSTFNLKVWRIFGRQRFPNNIVEVDEDTFQIIRDTITEMTYFLRHKKNDITYEETKSYN
jgi:hypothetical protein